MYTAFISSASQWRSVERAVAKAQGELAVVGEEVSSGQLNDIGLVLGKKSSLLVSNRQLSTNLEELKMTQTLVSSRLAATQSVLQSVGELISGFQSNLLAANGDVDNRARLQADARSRLDALVGLMSTTSDGAYLLAGENSEKQPLVTYDRSPDGKAAVASEFTAAFGFDQTSPAVRDIVADDMSNYLDGLFSSLEQSDNWNLHFSQSSDATPAYRILAGETVRFPATSNVDAVKSFYLSLVATIDSGNASLSGESYSALIRKVTGKVGHAATALVQVQSDVGIVQARVEEAETVVDESRAQVSRLIRETEAVDAYEAALRLNELSKLLQTSYSVTARLHSLSLLEYL